MKKCLTALLLIAMAAMSGGCVQRLAGPTVSFYSNFTAADVGGKYTENGTVHLKGDENAVSLYVDTDMDVPLRVSGSLTAKRGDATLLLVAPDGTASAVADTRGGGKTPTSIDTYVTLPSGLSCLRFDGADAVCRFDLAYSGLDQVGVRYYGRMAPAGAGSVASASTGIPADAGASAFAGIPAGTDAGASAAASRLHCTSNSRFTEISDSTVLLDFQLEKDTDVLVFVAADVRNRDGGRIKVGSFDVTLRGEKISPTEIIHHAMTDSSWGDFRWTDHNSAPLSLPKGSYQLILSSMEGKNYELLLDASVSETVIPK